MSHFFLSGIWLQERVVTSNDSTTWLMVFVGLVALALIVQAIALIVMAVGAAKARKRGLAILSEIRDKSMPAIDAAQTFIAASAPKILTLAENLSETSTIVRKKAAEFDVTLSDLNSKARAQTQKADDIASTVLSGASDIVNAVQYGIRVPVREFNGLMNALKAGIDVLVGKPRGYATTSNGSRYTDASYPRSTAEPRNYTGVGDVPVTKAYSETKPYSETTPVAKPEGASDIRDINL